MPTKCFNFDAKALKDLEKARKKLKSDGRLPSASSAVRVALGKFVKGKA